jgi:putative SOS response-associated peptidase YedK
MCNRYNIKTNLKEIASEIGAMGIDVQIAFDFDYGNEIFPKSIAPTLAINRQGVTQLRPMKFGFGSDHDRGPALNNARIESSEKWPWKSSFEKYRCVVPISSFREPCYWGPEAGKELNFSSAQDDLLLAAAIFTFDKSQAEEPVPSMSLIMRPALPFVMEHGHHRSPFFLDRDSVGLWMDRTPRSVAQSRQMLQDGACQPSLRYDVARQMAATWNKRQSANLSKRDEQLAEIEKTGPLGIADDFTPDGA